MRDGREGGDVIVLQRNARTWRMRRGAKGCSCDWNEVIARMMYLANQNRYVDGDVEDMSGESLVIVTVMLRT